MGSVRRTYVNRDVVCYLVNRFEAFEIVGYCLFDRDAARFADVHAQHALGTALANALRQLCGAAIIKSRAVNERAIARQTKKSGPRIARLWLAGDRTNFD